MSPKAVWSPTDIDKLLEILKEEKASAGNGGNFKKATFRKAAEELEKIREKGGPKTGTVCESKWQKVGVLCSVVGPANKDLAPADISCCCSTVCPIRFPLG